MSDQTPHSSATSTASTLGATSKTPYQLLLSPEFLICAGSVLFRLPSRCSVTNISPVLNGSARFHSSKPSNNNSIVPLTPLLDGSSDDDEPDEPLQICLIHHLRKQEYLLSKGRKDQFEDSLIVTAMRETYEEMGYPCRPLPVTITTRAPTPGKDIKVRPNEYRNSHTILVFFFLAYLPIPLLTRPLLLFRIIRLGHQSTTASSLSPSLYAIFRQAMSNSYTGSYQKSQGSSNQGHACRQNPRSAVAGLRRTKPCRCSHMSMIGTWRGGR